MSADERNAFFARALARLVENWVLKVIALVVSVVLFFVVHQSSDAQHSIEQRMIEVEVFEKPPEDPNLVRLTPLPLRLRVTVRGPRALLDELPTNVEPVTLDLTHAPDRINLDELDFKLPLGVQKVQVVPKYVTITWNPKITKSVPVEVTWNAPPEGLAIRGLGVEPARISVTGPKSIVDLMQRVRTIGLDLSHREAGHQMQLLAIDLSENPALVGSSDAVVTLAPDTVEAQFDLVPETKTRTFADLVILALHGKGVTLRPQKVSVVATCPPRRADELTAAAIVPKIDLEALGPDFAKKGPEETDVKVDIPGCDVSVSPPQIAISR